LGGRRIIKKKKRPALPAFPVWCAFRDQCRAEARTAALIRLGGQRSTIKDMDNDTQNSRELPENPVVPLRRRAKIVCTIGPASDTEDMMRDLMLRGMNVARLNFSHGTHEDHARVIRRLRKVAAELGRTICILQDLQGPKIRTGRLKDRMAITLRTGQTITITSRDVMGTAEIISTTYQDLARDVKPGEQILLSDRRIALMVMEV